MSNRAVLLVLLASVSLTGCFKLPETSSENRDSSAVDEATLRALTEFDSLGICTEDGWTGMVTNASESDLRIEIVVEFIGLGAEPLGSGSTTIDVGAGAGTDFAVIPEPELDDFAISCNIDMAQLTVLTSSD